MLTKNILKLIIINLLICFIIIYKIYNLYFKNINKY